MGTSSSSGGAGGSNPLIPGWIGISGSTGNGDGPDDGSPDSPSDGDKPNAAPDSDGNENNRNTPDSNIPDSNQDPQSIPGNSNRYTPSRKSFNKYIKGNGNNSSHLKNALKSYVTKGGGGSSVLSRRMKPSASRVGIFINTINDIKASGKVQVLTQVSLSAYINKPLNETLAALSDEIFKDTGKPYEDTQDDSITKQAYSNTIIRICELGDIDLDNLSNENIEVMTAIFIEETIAQRVICDIGNNLTIITSDIDKLLEIESNVYQIISGLVRTQIMPEIIATQLGDKKSLDKNIQNIYRIAFDAITGAED